MGLIKTKNEQREGRSPIGNGYQISGRDYQAGIRLGAYFHQCAATLF